VIRALHLIEFFLSIHMLLLVLSAIAGAVAVFELDLGAVIDEKRYKIWAEDLTCINI
jgi:hypothetical protein